MTPLSLLGIAFIIMKVMGIIAWSWWWVLAPFWAIPAILLFPFVAVCFGALVAIIGAAIISIFEKKKR